MVESKSHDDKNIDGTIITYLTRDANHDNDLERIEKDLKNHQRVYYEYKKIYNSLSQKLNDKEIFAFLKAAADSISDANATIMTEPDKRSLTFVKIRTWYIYGSDMTIKLQ